MTPLEIIREWRKGCSNTIGKSPAECVECTEAMVAALERSLTTVAHRHPDLQAGMTNDELRAAWVEKLPGVQPTDRDLSAFALGAEVGWKRAIRAAACVAQPEDSFRDEWFNAKADAHRRILELGGDQ